jgi:hypothetical protein
MDDQILGIVGLGVLLCAIFIGFPIVFLWG